MTTALQLAPKLAAGGGGGGLAATAEIVNAAVSIGAVRNIERSDKAGVLSVGAGKKGCT